jgi:hypothetical protein
MTKKIKEKYIPVSIEKGHEGHRYIVPLHLTEKFRTDLLNSKLVNSDEFEVLYNTYLIIDDIIQIPLFIYSEK